MKDNVWLSAYGGQIDIGDQVLVGRNNVIFGHGGVTIGALSMLGPNVSVLSSEHSTAVGDGVPAFQMQPEHPLPVAIGVGVWIGAGATVLGGTDIADNVVVAAGAVVRGRLESGWVYGGVPARPLKSLESGGLGG